MPSEVWKVRLLGGFRVESPDGEEILIPSRKARALLALLALNDGIAISRESLGGHLWSDKPRVKQQQSLRQAVKEVRDAFAPTEALESTRDVCRLALDYTCDALDCLNSGKDAGNAAFLPEMPEPVFDSYRTELASFAPLGDIGEAARGAASLLEWTLNQFPIRVLETLHTCRELMPSMPIPLLESALRAGVSAVPANHPLQRWGKSQFAVVLMWAGRDEEGMRVAREALNVAQPERDTTEWTAAVHSAATFLIFRGKFDRANKLLADAIEIAKLRNLTDAVDRFRHADALREVYSGNFDLALQTLDSLPSNAFRETHRAICLVLAGRKVEARTALESVKASAQGDQDTRLASQIGIAESYLLIAEDNTTEARALMNDLLNFSESYGIRAVQIQALEGLALLDQDEVSRKEKLGKAMALRERHRFPLLPADKIRLAAILD